MSQIASDMYASDMYFVRKILFQECLPYVGMTTLLTLCCYEHEYMTNDSSQGSEHVLLVIHTTYVHEFRKYLLMTCI
jgi:hypothetical protein